MKPNFTLTSLVLVVMSAALLVLSGCSDKSDRESTTPPPITPTTTTIFPAINPPFDEITEVAVSPDPGGGYDDVLEPDTDYTYDPETESITSTGSVDPGGAYVRITGLATLTGTQSSYTVYTYIASGGVQVAANELTSAAVGLVASGDAADFNAALTLVENEFGLPSDSAANPVPADQRSAELTSVLAAAAPAFASGADPAFDVADFVLADLTAAQGEYVACVEQGGLAWDSWHKTDAGGSNLPADEGDNDYTRCKACHGWDQQGTDGGYVRRSRNAGRANAGYQDPNNCDLPGADPATCTQSRNISTDAIFGSGSAIGIPAGGRTWAQGSAVFDELAPANRTITIGNFTMFDPGGGLVGGATDVSGTFDDAKLCDTESCTDFAMTLASDQPFFGVPWIAHDIRVFSEGTYTFDSSCTAAEIQTGITNCAAGPGATITLVVATGQLGAHILFDYGPSVDIDVAILWDQEDSFGAPIYDGCPDPGTCDTAQTPTKVWNLVSRDGDSSGIRGFAMVDGPFGGFHANFNLDIDDSSWGPGAILGNRHPDLSAANAEGPTAQQLSCLTSFLNAPEARADQVYAAMDTVPADGNSLAIYTPVTTADAAAGKTYYDANCQGCHGDPSADSTDPGLTGGLIGYLNSDGKFSEFMHKMHWGIPNTIMSRAAMGDPTAADVANVVAYMQAVPFMELSAAQVVSAVAGIVARGSGTYTLTDSSLEYVIIVDEASLSGPITSATFNLGRVGTNGDAIHTLDAFAGGQSQGVWAGPSAEQRTALLAGNVYVVIKTTANPEGEIRGQVKAVFAGVNQPPVADAGTDQGVDTGSLVTLNGGGSSDPDAGPLPLSYSWVLDTVPAGSTATLANANTASPTFTADMDGTYTATLVVNDGADDSAPDSVTVTATTPGGGGDFATGLADYDARCAGCHDAGTHDSNGGFAGDIAGTGNLLVNDLSTINVGMNIMLTDQEILDLQAFLDDPSIQP